MDRLLIALFSFIMSTKLHLYIQITKGARIPSAYCVLKWLWYLRNYLDRWSKGNNNILLPESASLVTKNKRVGIRVTILKFQFWLMRSIRLGHPDGSHPGAIGHCVTNEGPSLLVHAWAGISSKEYCMDLTMHFEVGTAIGSQYELIRVDIKTERTIPCQC